MSRQRQHEHKLVAYKDFQQIKSIFNFFFYLFARTSADTNTLAISIDACCISALKDLHKLFAINLSEGVNVAVTNDVTLISLHNITLYIYYMF